MRNNAGKKKQNRIAGFSRKVLVPSFAGAAYAMSRMTVTVLAAGGDTSAVTKPLDNLIIIGQRAARKNFGRDERKSALEKLIAHS